MVCLLIINYNDFKNTNRLINNVNNYKFVDKIVVVDNKSTDNSYEELMKLNIPKLDIILSDCNKGYSYAINIGLKYIETMTSDAKVFVSNSDIIIKSEDDLKKLIETSNNKLYGVVGPVIDEHGVLNRGWKIPSPFIDALMNLVLVHNIVRKKRIFYKDSHYDNKESIVDVVSGCFFLVNLSDMKEINYFDDNVFLYYEENILAKRLAKINKKEVIDNEVTIIHDHAATIDNNIKRIKKFKILKESQYYFQTRYNHANIFEKGLLKLNKNISLIIYHIIGFIKRSK